MEDRGFDAYRGDLNQSCVTIAEALKPAGYQTLMCGKWHVTKDLVKDYNWPRQRGFDRFYGTITGAGNFFNPTTLVRDNTPVPDVPDPGYYYTDAIADNAVQFIADAARQPAPFFLYVAFTSPHWPLHAKPADIAKYKGRYRQGWDALRRERHARQIGMGLVDKRWGITDRDASVPAWEEAKDKEWQERRMEVYAAQIDAMDQGIGRIVAKLKELNVFEDTLILMLADNGGCAEELGRNYNQPTLMRAKTKDGRVVRGGNHPDLMPGGEDSYQSYGIGWANASNTPFRRYKHWVHEGGISSPLIAHWPRVIRKGNTITNQPGYLIDLMATCVDVAGARYPATYQGRTIPPLEGKSLRPIFEGKRRATGEVFWEHEGNRAVRQGKWKLVSQYPGEWELYDIDADRTERKNLAEANPAKLRELAAKWDAWAQRAGVVPWSKVMPSAAGAQQKKG
jgi:arylsulfatase